MSWTKINQTAKINFTSLILQLLKQMFNDYVCIGNSNKYPTVVMSIKVNPALVDVNVEPNKTKVYLQLKVSGFCSHLAFQVYPWLLVISAFEELRRNTKLFPMLLSQLL